MGGRVKAYKPRVHYGLKRHSKNVSNSLPSLISNHNSVKSQAALTAYRIGGSHPLLKKLLSQFLAGVKNKIQGKWRFNKNP